MVKIFKVEGHGSRTTDIVENTRQHYALDRYDIKDKKDCKKQIKTDISGFIQLSVSEEKKLRL